MEQRKSDKEIRIANISDFNIEQREEDDGKLIIEGYAAVYDSETLIGSEDWGFYEKIERGAFDEANMKDVPLKYNHDDSVPILARTRNKSLVLTPDEKGLHVRAELLNTTDGVDMYKRIKAGLIDKMSFAFTVATGGDEYKSEAGKTPHRTIRKFSRIYDVSVVDTPAYDDTEIYARSLELADAWRGKSDDLTNSDELALAKAKNKNIMI